MDRPGGRKRRRRPVPLGNHADRRPGGGGQGDPPRAEDRRPRRIRGLGPARPKPLGHDPQPGDDRRWGWPSARTPTRRACSGWPPTALWSSCSNRPGFTDVKVAPVALERRYDTADEFVDETLELSPMMRRALAEVSEPDRQRVSERILEATQAYTARRRVGAAARQLAGRGRLGIARPAAPERRLRPDPATLKPLTKILHAGWPIAGVFVCAATVNTVAPCDPPSRFCSPSLFCWPPPPRHRRPLPM